MKTIGILGGMGPEATAELYLRVIKIFQKDYGAIYDNDFPEIIILNLPIPDVVEKNISENQVLNMLIKGAKKLERAGVDFIAVPCNTVTKYFSSIRKKISIPLVSIVDETVENIKKQDVFCVGLLGTKTTLNSNIYQDKLDIDVVLPKEDEQIIITHIIMNVLSGKKLNRDILLLDKIIENMKLKGANKIILGCTELPLLIKGDDLIDTIEILARKIVNKAILS